MSAQLRLLENLEEIKAYALRDAEASARLFLEHGSKWPEQERELSCLTIDQGNYGVCLDVPLVETGISSLIAECESAYASLPWYGTSKPTSTKALAAECGRVGIRPPISTSEDDPACMKWEQKHGSQFPWVANIRRWRKANRLLKVLMTMRDRVRPDGTLPFSLKYFGAIHTGRWSGDAGLNLQNLNREPYLGVDPRRCLRARPGHTLIISDLAQIEPRVLAWLCGDAALLEKLRTGMPLYQAHAVATMGWNGGNLKKENPKLYALAKARCVAEGTFLLTDRGYVRIEQVTSVDMVWDGDDFQHHAGLVHQGDTETTLLFGERFTSDHLIFKGEFSSQQAGTISEGQLSEFMAWREAPCSDWKDLWLLACAIGVSLSQEGRLICALLVQSLFAGVRRFLAQLKKRKDRKVQPMRSLGNEKLTQSQKLGEANR